MKFKYNSTLNQPSIINPGFPSDQKSPKMPRIARIEP